MQIDIDKEVALLQRMTVGSCERNSKRRGRADQHTQQAVLVKRIVLEDAGQQRR